MKTYRPYTPEQSFLLPPSPSEWLPENHLAYFVLELLEDLELGEITRAVQGRDHRGERPYSPRMMTALLLYGYAVGVFSSRKIERATHEDVAFRVLAAGEHPHFTTINPFRSDHRNAFAGLFQQLLEECMSAGLVKLGHVAIDGTKMKANASKHKAMSHDRMVKDEARLKAEVEALIARAEAVDAEEDKLYGVGQQPSDLPAELQRREDRIAKIREVRAALKKETEKRRAAVLAEQAERLRQHAAELDSHQKREELTTKAALADQQSADLDDDDPDPPAVDGDLPKHSPPADRDGAPKPKAQRNFTDPDSRIMMRDGAFLQAYNAQIAVDEGHQIIVAATLSNQGPDAQYFEPMLRRVVDNCDAVPEITTSDAGYFSDENVRAAEHMGTEVFIAVGSHLNSGMPADDEPTMPRNFRSEAREVMRARLESPRGRAAYARRKATVEPVFGQIRSCRGFRQLSLRGLLKARCEWLLVCATHNLLKLWRWSTRQQLSLTAA
ncbi:MAG TPA: IS1182 family transposase [Polyangiales bacterium]|nr:IS1182 family transposase [Polyangiales bacterium]